MVNSGDRPQSSWYTHDNGWDTSWSYWNEGADTESPSPVILRYLSETMTLTNNLDGYLATHLFLGLNPTTGAPEMFDLSRPRSLMIKTYNDNTIDCLGGDVLETFVRTIKLRSNQKHFPVTVITYDDHRWDELRGLYPGLVVASPDERYGDGVSLMRQIALSNARRQPHILVIDQLNDLLDINQSDESILEHLLWSGAESRGVYVLASYHTPQNIKTGNKLRSWVGRGNMLYAEVEHDRTLILKNGTQIFVPEPK